MPGTSARRGAGSSCDHRKNLSESGHAVTRGLLWPFVIALHSRRIGLERRGRLNVSPFCWEFHTDPDGARSGIRVC